MILMAQGCHPSGNQRCVSEGMCQSYCKGILGQSGGEGQNLTCVWPEIDGVLKVADVEGRQGISVRFCDKGKYLRKSLKWCFCTLQMRFIRDMWKTNVALAFGTLCICRKSFVLNMPNTYHRVDYVSVTCPF